MSVFRVGNDKGAPMNGFFVLQYLKIKWFLRLVDKKSLQLLNCPLHGNLNKTATAKCELILFEFWSCVPFLRRDLDIFRAHHHCQPNTGYYRVLTIRFVTEVHSDVNVFQRGPVVRCGTKRIRRNQGQIVSSGH